jgi:hypothetical protein
LLNPKQQRPILLRSGAEEEESEEEDLYLLTRKRQEASGKKNLLDAYITLRIFLLCSFPMMREKLFQNRDSSTHSSMRSRGRYIRALPAAAAAARYLNK